MPLASVVVGCDAYDGLRGVAEQLLVEFDMDGLRLTGKQHEIVVVVERGKDAFAAPGMAELHPSCERYGRGRGEVRDLHFGHVFAAFGAALLLHLQTGCRQGVERREVGAFQSAPVGVAVDDPAFGVAEREPDQVHVAQPGLMLLAAVDFHLVERVAVTRAAADALHLHVTAFHVVEEDVLLAGLARALVRRVGPVLGIVGNLYLELLAEGVLR